VGIAIVSKISKNAMQSSVKNFGSYVVKFENQSQDFCDKNTGYVKTVDTNNQVVLNFDSLDLAISYIKNSGMEYKIVDNSLYSKFKKSYSKNFTKDPSLEY
jgi:hypothetical protein